MAVTELGIVNEVRLLQFQNALFPMEVTVPGIVNVVRFEQRLNAP